MRRLSTTVLLNSLKFILQMTYSYLYGRQGRKKCRYGFTQFRKSQSNMSMGGYTYLIAFSCKIR